MFPLQALYNKLRSEMLDHVSTPNGLTYDQDQKSISPYDIKQALNLQGLIPIQTSSQM